MHETGAQGWCTGKTQRDWVEREVGRGIGMGNTCNSMANSCQCMTKTLQYCKVTSLQLLKTNEKQKKEKPCGQVITMLTHLYTAISNWWWTY